MLKAPAQLRLEDDLEAGELKKGLVNYKEEEVVVVFQKEREGEAAAATAGAPTC